MRQTHKTNIAEQRLNHRAHQPPPEMPMCAGKFYQIDEERGGGWERRGPSSRWDGRGLSEAVAFRLRLWKAEGLPRGRPGRGYSRVKKTSPARMTWAVLEGIGRLALGSGGGWGLVGQGQEVGF